MLAQNDVPAIVLRLKLTTLTFSIVLIVLYLFHPHTVIIIAGPTAVGKTSLAIQIAQHYKTDILSADSRQCFKELSIGVAKPGAAELAAVRHYFINSHSVTENVTAATFEQYALLSLKSIFTHSNIAVMAGGTGLYIRSFCEGLDAIPEIPDDVRQRILLRYKYEGIAFLQNELQQKDPLFWQTAEQQNPHRLMRALEVLYATGKSIAAFRNKTPASRPFNIIKIGLELSRDILYQRINLRVEEMVKGGLVDEVKSLLPYKHLNALQTVGYKELFNFFDGKVSLQQAINNIQQNTRHYAKRQLTWFKKDPQFTWFPPDDYDGIIAYVKSKLPQ